MGIALGFPPAAKKKGKVNMEGSVLRLLIYTVVAAAIIYIIISFFSAPPLTNEEAFEKGLDYSEGNLGKSQLYTLRLSKDSGYGAANLDSPTRNVRFECTSAETCFGAHISIKPRILSILDDTVADAYFRCVYKETLNDCVIYFGQAPAQIEISGVSMDGNVGRGDNVSVSFDVKNAGNLDALELKTEIKIYERKKEGGEEILVLTQEVSGKIDKIPRGET